MRKFGCRPFWSRWWNKKPSAVRRKCGVVMSEVMELEPRELLTGNSFLPSNPDVARNNGPQSHLVVRANFQNAALDATARGRIDPLLAETGCLDALLNR